MKMKTNQFLALTLAVVLLVSTLPGCSSTLTKPEAKLESYKVSMDVNPSIELTITDEKVASVEAFNDDGTVILLATDVLGMPAADAVIAVVKEMASAGYIAKTEIKPYLLITVAEDEAVSSDASEALIASLEAAAEATLVANELDCRVKSTVASIEIEQASDALGLSIGRYLLFKYIAQEQDVTIEDALATYGHLTIGELMDMFADAKFAYKYHEKKHEVKEDEESGSNSNSSSEILTPDQQVAVKAATAQLKLDREAARVIFHETYKSIKEIYKTGLEALRTHDKKNEKTELKVQRTVLREKMLADRRLAIIARADAVTAAKAKFLQTLSGLGISVENFEKYLDGLNDDEDSDQNEEESNSEDSSSIDSSSEESSSMASSSETSISEVSSSEVVSSEVVSSDDEDSNDNDSISEDKDDDNDEDSKDCSSSEKWFSTDSHSNYGKH